VFDNVYAQPKDKTGKRTMSGDSLISDIIANGMIIGAGATAAMDVWAFILQRFFAIAPLNYALVGRWLAYMPRGIFHHNNIGFAKPVTAELAVGWAAHYLTGIIFSITLIIFTGNDWLSEPSLLFPIAFGALTVGFPFFLMQPCMGLGIAAAKTPKPNLARLRSLQTHLVFGLGLYFSAMLRTLFLAQ